MTRLLKLSLFTSLALMACSQASEAPRVSADVVTEIALSDVPQSVQAVVTAARADFTMTEVLKKERGERVYYDVEGELASGEEIEFDVLMTEAGPQIVEIQRDILWAQVPAGARALVDGANKDGADIVRVIESRQTDDSIIYEIFIAGHKSDPRFEAQVKDGKATLLPERWEH